MEKYVDIDNDSGIDEYEVNESSITIRFKKASKPYTYSYSSAGERHVEAMKKLARSGNGLNKYLNTYVKNSFNK